MVFRRRAQRWAYNSVYSVLIFLQHALHGFRLELLRRLKKQMGLLAPQIYVGY